MEKSNIYNCFEEYFKKSPIEVAKELHYKSENIFVLELDANDINKLILKNSDLYSRLKSCGHNKDSRTIIEYAQDIICSWLIEDYIMNQLKEAGLEVELSGEDRERTLLKSNKVSSNSDFFIKSNGKKAYIELVNSYKDYWQKQHVCDLRDSKYNHLKEMANSVDKSLILGIDLKYNLFFLVDICDPDLKVKNIPYHFIYHKPAYAISITKDMFKDYNINSLANAIKTELK